MVTCKMFAAPVRNENKRGTVIGDNELVGTMKIYILTYYDHDTCLHRGPFFDKRTANNLCDLLNVQDRGTSDATKSHREYLDRHPGFGWKVCELTVRENPDEFEEYKDWGNEA
jgi:hypothetical protein